jgi:uncharacterized YigZ family protein
MIDSYFSIKEPASARIARERSRFIGLLFPARDEEEVEEILERTRRDYHDASHRPYAYRFLGESGPRGRAEDAGEPRGTAGAPILQALETAGVYALLAVVVRYFGGTKLGRGGLARAYGDATRAALEAATRVERRPEVRVSIRFPSELGASVMGLVHRHAAKVERVDYAGEGRILVLLPLSHLGRFQEELTEATGARARCEEGG